MPRLIHGPREIGASARRAGVAARQQGVRPEVNALSPAAAVCFFTMSATD